MRPPRPARVARPPERTAPPPSSTGQRIAKLLARAGIASRREVERMIAEGRVALNGSVIDTPATVLASLAGITVDGNPVETPADARLFLYHKPSGLLVTERDPAGRPTIYDHLAKDLPRLMPVGRLDLNTEGLLLLTTDGELKRQLELPATGVERAYRARAYGMVTQAQLEALIEGVEIEGVRYGSINANIERRTGANVWIELILTEGKNREVRRVLDYLGLKVSRLIRTRYGPFLLADLPPNGIGEVRAHDVAAFRKDPTRNPPPERSDAPRASRSAARQAPPRPAAPERTAARASRPAPGSAPADRRSPRADRARKHREAGAVSAEPKAAVRAKRLVRHIKESRPGDAEAPRSGARADRPRGGPVQTRAPSTTRHKPGGRPAPAGRGKR